MPQQELNLLKLAPARMSQLRTSPPQVVWSNMLQARSFAAGLHDVPRDILRDALSPYLAPGDGSKDPSLPDSGCPRPLIERGFNPTWNGNGADVVTLADEIHHRPVPLAHLDVVQL
jgi:hypothetical protein